MIDIHEIEKTITELKQGKTTFDNCDKLAALFIVHDHLAEAPKETAPMPALSSKMSKQETFH